MPAVVSDRSDGQIVHLDGLNLSRAWCMWGIAQVLPPDDRRRSILLEAAERHARVGLIGISSGDYMGEHWLGSFALYMLRGSVLRTTRYQGAIIRDDHILLLKQTEHASGRSYWQIPGGGIEPDETEEQCVQREMREETGLHVQVHSLILDEPSTPGAIYQRWKTYRCAILAGEARPGSEPEAVYADAYSFTEVGWFDLRHPATWNERLEADSYIYSFLQRVQAALGYTVAPGLQDRTEGLV